MHKFNTIVPTYGKQPDFLFLYSIKSRIEILRLIPKTKLKCLTVLQLLLNNSTIFQKFGYELLNSVDTVFEVYFQF